MKTLLQDYAEWTDDTWFSADDPDRALMIAALGLAGETGEVIELVKKFARGDGPIDTNRLKLELGDVMYYAARLCRMTGIDFDSVFEANVEKLMARKINGTQRGSGDYR